MEREEAIEELEQRLSTLKILGGSYVDCVNGEAIKVAIEALKQPEIIRCKDCLYYERGGRCGCHCMQVLMSDYCSYAAGTAYKG